MLTANLAREDAFVAKKQSLIVAEAILPEVDMKICGSI
jgi:hypothetical protein